MLSNLEQWLRGALTAVILAVSGITSVNASSDCSSWLVEGPAALFNRGLKTKKIDNLISDRYSASEIDGFVKGSKLVAENATIADQARPRQAITPAPEINRNLRVITSRILAEWSYTAPEFDMYLTSWRFYTPFTTIDGDILVPIGFLQRAQSDDEIAFLLAHEISHLLLGHPALLAEKTKQKKMLRAFRKKSGAAVTYSSATLSLVSLTESESGRAGTPEDLTKLNARIFQYYAHLRDFATEFVHPAWQSKQEDEADLLALELILLAGYSPDGVDQALTNLQTAEESFCESIKAFSSDLEDFVKGEFATHLTESLMTDNTDLMGVILQETSEFSKKKIAKLLVQQALPKTHRPYEKRRKYIWKYVDRPAMEDIMEAAEERDPSSEIIAAIQQSGEFRTLMTSTNAIAAIQDALLDGDMDLARENIPGLVKDSQQTMILKYRFHMTQGDHDKASENIDIALRYDYPSLAAYETHFAKQLENGSFEIVSERIGEVQTLYRDHIYFLPEKIFISANQSAGRGEESEGDPETDALLKTCTDSNRDSIEGPCYAAALGTRADFRLRFEEILATTDCTMVEKTGGDVLCANTQKKNIFSGLNVWDKIRNNKGS